MNTILCPHCGKQIEISEALSAQLEQAITKREKERFEKELEAVKKTALEESAQKVRESFELQLKRLQEESIAKEKQNKELLSELTKLTEQLRLSKKERDEAELTMQKKLAEEEEKIRLEAIKKAEEEQRLKILEKEKQLQDALKANEDMRRKLQQGSQQLQGEVFEAEFEEMLAKQYPNDKIVPVGKGIRGGDIIQEVWDRRGNYAGKILWELKNTKNWSEEWVDKLKSNQREITAEEAVIISEVLPTAMKVAGFYDNIWVTKQNFVVPLADTLRAKLIQMHYVKKSVKVKDQKMEILYDYLSGIEFRHRVEAIIEAFTNMQEEIEKEKRYFQNKWARDEKNIRQVVDNTYGMHGDLKGIVGSMLPQIKGIELLDDGNDE